MILSGTIACGVSEPTVVGTLDGVGDLPGILTSDGGLGALAEMNRSELLAARPEVGMADLVVGPRVMLIGDSIFASASRRHSGEICAALTPLGFDVEVNAEVGRFVEFGERVLERRLRPDAGVDWDAVIISLGSNFGGDLGAYRARLIRILDKLDPRPVLLFTVSEFKSDRIRLNDVIVEMVRMYPNVFVVDWSAIVGRDPSLLHRDRLHLTQAGRDQMAAEMVRALGTHSMSRPGKCLPTEFSDDSAISDVEDASVIIPTPSGNGRGSSTSSTIYAPDAPGSAEDDIADNGETDEIDNGGSNDEGNGAPPSTTETETSVPATTVPATTVPAIPGSSTTSAP